ncbi:hypothetical protein KUTeg_015549 [Tegillarca granosa]|uniref:Uncharacterized protein n=1 Tax=Tegillarca granosa TaxID=220873 RepID=A0ABQ9EUV5_TEGGR|nr:hypothetical protein KUTeg_015549 [Tegillarca granosa]
MASVGSRLHIQILKILCQREGFNRCFSSATTCSYRKKQYLKRIRNCNNGQICNNKVQSCASSSSANVDTSTENKVNPFKLVEHDLATISDDIKKKLMSERLELRSMAQYLFDGQGKLFRPLVVLLMAQALNCHNSKCDNGSLLSPQKEIAMIAEMIHTASLIHDDVIDTSATRRGKPTAILTGDYILSEASIALARLKNDKVVSILSQLIDDTLDFTSCDMIMGKPTAADLRLGLATAPVLFAAQEHSELNAMIMRRFSQEGDVEKAREYYFMSTLHTLINVGKSIIFTGHGKYKHSIFAEYQFLKKISNSEFFNLMLIDMQ